MLYLIEDSRQKVGKHDLKAEYFQSAGVPVTRCKLPYGDYALAPRASIDTKENIEEVAANICGKEHGRFIAECKLARDNGADLYVLVENENGIKTIREVCKWINPRVIYSPDCVQGPRLQKAMETIEGRYGVTFLFCRPNESGEIIKRILGYYDNGDAASSAGIRDKIRMGRFSMLSNN